jgi:hypothetical protein
MRREVRRGSEGDFDSLPAGGNWEALSSEFIHKERYYLFKYAN